MRITLGTLRKIIREEITQNAYKKNSVNEIFGFGKKDKGPSPEQKAKLQKIREEILNAFPQQLGRQIKFDDGQGPGWWKEICTELSQVFKNELTSEFANNMVKRLNSWYSHLEKNVVTKGDENATFASKSVVPGISKTIKLLEDYLNEISREEKTSKMTGKK